jgi:serine/threonine protein kinase
LRGNPGSTYNQSHGFVIVSCRSLAGCTVSISVEQFLQALATSGIMASEEVQSLAQGLPAEKRGVDADELARGLVREGKLTRFQAAAIYQEKSDGLLLGNYLILDKLGAGGMGQVFRARHRRMDRVVALKLLSKKLLDSPDAVVRFQREVKAAARLTHPNIVTAYDADEAGGMHFLVMEYVEGADLAAVVKKQGILPVNDALDLVLQAARGLEHAHDLGVVHRDIKPSNLLLDKKGTVKILDMGLARMADPLADPRAGPSADLTHTGSIMGTIDYMAPEQAMDSRQADARSDLYSLGCVLHYLLTGRPPYGGDTVMKRLTAHQQTAIPLLSKLRPDISPAVEQLFARLVAKSPDARFQTAKELAAAIETLRKEPTVARPVPVAAAPILVQPLAVSIATATSGVRNAESIRLPGFQASSSKGRKKKSANLPLAAAVVVLLLTAGGGAWVMFGSKPQPTAQAERPSLPETDQPPATEAVAAPASTEQPNRSTAVTANEESSAPQPVEAMPAKEPSATVGPLVSPVASEPALPAVASTAAEVTSTPPRPNAVPTVPVVAAHSPASVATAPAALAAEGDGRLPVPSAEAQRASLAMIKDLYKEDYAQAKQPEAKAILAQKLLDASAQAEDDATAWYVVVHEASEMAVDAADPELVERAIDMLSRRFAVAPLDVLASALTEMAAHPHPAEANHSIAEAALARVDEAQAAEDFEDAKRFADVAAVTARKAKDPALAKLAVEAGKSLAVARQQWNAWQKAQETLAENADDPVANLAAGRYLCFVRGDWEQGITHLAKGSDGPLRDLAVENLKPADEPDVQVDRGDAWFAAAEKSKTKDKADLRAGAAYWYTRAEPGLSGLSKARVEKRLAELGGKISIRAASSPMPVANGFSLPQQFDCSVQAYPVTAGPDFNSQKNWTLLLEFLPTNLDNGSHQLFFWGDGRGSHDPICLRLDHETLETRLCDARKKKDDTFVLGRKVSADVVGSWHRAAVHYDAAQNDVSMYLDGELFAQGKSLVVPTADRPMKMFLGGEHETGQRYYGQLRNVWLGNQDEYSPTGSADTSTATVANGVSLPETFDCQAQSYPIKLGPSFELDKSWTLKLSVQLPNLEPGSHMIFYWGDSRAGHNPMAVGQDDAVLHAWMSDCKANVDHELQIPIDRALVGQWLDLIVRFDAVDREFAAYLNGRLAKQEPAKVTPNFDRPMPLLIGADARKKCRFTGQVRNVWLGNQDDFLPPGSNASLASIGLRPRRKNNFDVASRVASATAPTGRTTHLGKKGDERQLALWALGIKGTVIVGSASGKPVKIPDPSALPAGPVTVVELRLSNMNGLDEAALPLRGLPSLKKLWLNGNTIGDVGLSQLTDLPALEELNVSGCNRITDRGMPALARLTSLNYLVLNSAQITDQGLAQLKSLTRLKHLAVVGTPVTGSGFAQWTPSELLNNLNVSNTPFGDAGVAQLRRFSGLDSLDLSKTRITDQGVASLAENVNLRNLYLRETNVSDAGVQKLGGLTTLKTLLVGPSVTDKGIASLRQALPRCRVDR